MLKFFRKYNKIILVFGGILLMIVFVAPQAVQQFGPNPMNAEVGKSDFGVITAGDLDLAAREQRAISQWSPMLATQLLALREEPIHWMLLTQEAEEGGFVGTPGDGVRWIPDLARQLIRLQYAGSVTNIDQFFETQFGQDELAEATNRLTLNRPVVAAGNRLTPVEFDTVIAKARGILRMTNYYLRENRLGRQRTATANAAYNDEVFANSLLVRAERFIDQIPAGTDAQLEELFNEYKDVVRADAANGIGYTLGERLKFEVLRIDGLEIASAQPLDPVEVRKYYAQNRSDFPASFEVERVLVENAFREQQAQEILRVADRAIRTYVLDRTRRLPEDDEGYKILPDSWESDFGNFEDVATIVQERLTDSIGASAPIPTVERFDQTFVTRDDFAELTQFEGVTARAGAVRFTMPAVLFSIRELLGDTPYKVQAGIPALDLTFESGDTTRLYVRVIDYRDVSPPDDWSELRDVLAEDYLLVSAMDYLESSRSAFEEIARGEGLSALAKQMNLAREFDENGEEIVLEYIPTYLEVASRFGETGVVTKVEALRAENVRDEVMRRGRLIDPLVREDGIDNAERYFSVNSDLPMGIVFFELSAFVPGTEERLRANYQLVTQSLRTRELTAATEDLLPFFSLSAMSERLNLETDVIDIAEIRQEAMEFRGLTDDEAVQEN